MGWTSFLRPLLAQLSPARRPPDSPGVSGVTIREVATRRELDQFIKLPWRIYAGDPHWVPRLLLEVKHFLNPKQHPFYRHGRAAKLLAWRGGEPVGRILVSDDPRYNESHGTNLGCFGMFESVDDPQVATALLDAAAAWIKAQGRTAITGPIDYSMHYPCGLLIEGFDTPPRLLMNHNPPYYAPLIEQWGLRKVKDLLAWWFVDPNDMVARWKPRTDWLARRGGIKIRPFNKRDFDAELERCKAVCKGFLRNWGFVEFTDAEFRHLATLIALIAYPKQVLLAEADGKPVGFSITLPDLNEAIRPLDGRLTTWGLPIGLIRLWHRLRKVKTARMLVLVVLEEYRRRGVCELLILHTLDYGKNVLGYTGAELSWTLEDNEMVTRAIQAVGAQPYKRYRIYQRELP